MRMKSNWKVGARGWFLMGCLFFKLSRESSALAANVQLGKPHDLGVGAVIGSPTGLSLKYWLTPATALDGVLAWHFGDEDQLQIHVDHLWHLNVPSLKVPNGRLPVYVGVGLRALMGEDAEAGVRIPVGLAYLLKTIPLEPFVEIAPVVRFAPDTGASLDGGVGIRYYFR